jgi:hypothetical protein
MLLLVMLQLLLQPASWHHKSLPTSSMCIQTLLVCLSMHSTHNGE